MSLLKFSLLFTLSLVFFGCCPSKDKVLLGKYYANHGKCSEYILLQQDSKYIHVVDGCGFNYKKEGVWRYGFDHCNLYLDSYADIVPNEVLPSPDSTKFGTHTYIYSSGILETEEPILNYVHESIWRK